MEIKKYIIIYLISLLLSNEKTEYQVTLYNIPMADVYISFSDTIYKDIKVIKLDFETQTNSFVSQFFKVDNKYQTIIKNNDFNIMSFEKLTYQPNVTNKIKTVQKGENILYENTKISIPKNHFNIFSLLYYLSNTPFEIIKDKVNVEREGLIYQCTINKKIINELYEFELQFNFLNNKNVTPVFQNTDLFTWALFRKGSKNKIIIEPKSNKIQKCTFSNGFSNLEAVIKKPLN